MIKKKIHICLITKEKHEEYNLLGEYLDNNTIIYEESTPLKTKTTINFNKKTLIRENIEYKINIKFEENKITNNNITLKDSNQVLKLDIKTIKFEVKENEINIEYIVLDSNERFIYNIKF